MWHEPGYANDVSAEGQAVVPSEVTASVQKQGLSCSLPEGGLAGQQLPELLGSADSGSSPGAVGSGPFTVSYTFAASKPGPYEVCAYLTPAASEKMYYGRPYEVGSADFSVQEVPVEPVSAQQAFTAPTFPAPPPGLSGVSMSHSHFRVAPGRAHPTKREVGTMFRFGLSEAATVTIGITRLLPGERVRGPLPTHLSQTSRTLKHVNEQADNKYAALRKLGELGRVIEDRRAPEPYPRASGPVPSLQELRRRRTEIERLAVRHGAREVRVFGSVARKETRPDSDLDVLVEMEPQRGLFEQAGLQCDLEELLQCPVDLATTHGLLYARDHTRKSIERDARRL